jgi:hypothetical protein
MELPICDRCGRLVDGLHVWEDSWNREYHAIAVCHGEVEEVVLTFEFVAAHVNDLTVGRAFVRPQTPLLGGKR